MKNLLVLSVLFFTCSTWLPAQDYIYLAKNHERIEAQNVRLTRLSVFYENFGDNSGRYFTLPVEDVELIVFENGETVDLTKTSPKEKNEDFNRNVFSYHLFDLVISDFTLSYERILGDGKIGIGIPFSVGFSEDADFGNMINTFYSGITLNLYPTGQGPIRYFMGPSLRLGMGHNAYGSYGDGDYASETDSFYGKLLINNGVIFTPVKAMSISAILSLGVRYFPEANYSSDEFRTAVAWSVNMSYRF